MRMGRKRVVVARYLEEAESGKSHRPVFERDHQPTDLAIAGGLDEIRRSSVRTREVEAMRCVRSCTVRQFPNASC